MRTTPRGAWSPPPSDVRHCGAASRMRPPVKLHLLADAQIPGCARPSYPIILVASTSDWTAMMLMIAAGWVLVVLMRSSWPARGQLLGFFCVDLVAVELLMCGMPLVLLLVVMPAVIHWGSMEP